MFGHLGSTKEIKSLIIFICFKWFKTILAAIFDEMTPKTGILCQNNDSCP